MISQQKHGCYTLTIKLLLNFKYSIKKIHCHLSFWGNLIVINLICWYAEISTIWQISGIVKCPLLRLSGFLDASWVSFSVWKKFLNFINVIGHHKRAVIILSIKVQHEQPFQINAFTQWLTLQTLRLLHYVCGWQNDSFCFYILTVNKTIKQNITSDVFLILDLSGSNIYFSETTFGFIKTNACFKQYTISLSW